MKKKICLMSFMLMGFVSLFTSCVEGDLYDLYDDGTEFISPRRKGVKDTGSQTQGSVNCLPNVPDYHRIVKAVGGCCNQRSLTAKWGSDWHCKIKEVISDILETYPPYDQEYISIKYGYPDNVVATVLNMGALETEVTRRIMGKMGFSVCEGYVGNLYTIKGASHTVYIVSKGSGNESNYYVDMDGNVWGPGALDPLLPM